MIEKQGPVLSRVNLSGEFSKVQEAEPWKGRGVFMFPGQGSQVLGMGKDLYEASPAARSVFDTADQILNFSLSGICFNGPLGELKKTQVGQLAIGTVSVAVHAAVLELYKELVEELPVAGCGVSFGELANLVIAGVIDLETFLQVIKDRGSIMEEVGKKNPGRMKVIFDLDKDTIDKVCRELGAYPAIYYPGVTTISGSVREVEEAAEALKGRGAKVRDAGVEYPFHTPLMEEARVAFVNVLAPIKFNDPKYPVILSVTGKPISSGDEIKDALPYQLTSSADMAVSVAAARAMGGSFFLELGPRPILSNHLKRGNRELVTYSVHDLKSLRDLQLSFKSA